MSSRLTLIDSQIEDYQSLIDQLPQDTEVVLINTYKDGVAQILAAIQERIKLDTIDIMSHGRPGVLLLGNGELSTTNLSDHSEQLAKIGTHLSESGCIFLYGCEVAKGSAGKIFIEQFARMTRAKVAASVNLTGAADLGGDWILEASTGKLDQQKALRINHYAHVLATTYSLTPSSTTVNEGDGKITFTITRSSSSLAETVYFSTVQDKGYSNSGDYTGIANQAVSFAVGETSKKVSVSITNDALVEGDEKFSAIIEKPIGTLLDSSTFTIQDNDTAATTYSLTPSTTTVNEGDGTVTFTITRSSSSLAETVYFSTVQDKGYTNSGDYTGIANQAVSFAVGETSKKVSVSIANDALVEGDEKFSAIIEKPIGTLLDSSTFTIADNDKSTSSELKATLDNILVAALNLSARAYSDIHLNDQKDEVNAATRNWVPLKEEDFAFSKEDGKFEVVNGNLLRYEYKNASGTVGLTMLDGKRTLGIAFEGTNTALTFDTALDLLQDIGNIKSYYDSLSNFTKSVVGYINDGKNNIKQVLVSGHSLGGAAAQSFMSEYGQKDDRFIGVTFGSPGTTLFQPVPDKRFVNIQHDGDPVVNAALVKWTTTSPYIVRGAIIKVIAEDDGLDGLLEEHTIFAPLNGEDLSYRETIDNITSRLNAELLFKDLIIGTNDPDNIKGGFPGNEVFIGLGNNDYIDGGLGSIDKAIYTAPRSSYELSKGDGKIYVTDLRMGANSDGIDTLNNIERIIFTDSAVALDLNASAGVVAKVIGAVAGRENIANTNYVSIGLSHVDNGMSYEDLAALALDAFGAKSPEQVTSLLWSNVVGSAPTGDQILPYIDMMTKGTTVGALGVLAAETILNQENIDLVGLMNKGIAYNPLDWFTQGI
ncbi:MAG: DUF4347 domain-containing protein [Nitrosomonas sp.]|uniref:DUF4347 domain-containing protein n=1 Tax=Nitrosomonas sp. TaxID=42353 RepID=UPI0032EB51F5